MRPPVCKDAHSSRFCFTHGQTYQDGSPISDIDELAIREFARCLSSTTLQNTLEKVHQIPESTFRADSRDTLIEKYINSLISWLSVCFMELVLHERIPLIAKSLRITTAQARTFISQEHPRTFFSRFDHRAFYEIATFVEHKLGVKLTDYDVLPLVSVIYRYSLDPYIDALAQCGVLWYLCS